MWQKVMFRRRDPSENGSSDGEEPCVRVDAVVLMGAI